MSDFDVDCPRCKRIKEQLKFAPPPPTPNAPVLPDLAPVKTTKQITPTQIGCCSLVVLFLLLSGIMCGSCSKTDTKDTPATITAPAQTETQPAQTYTPPIQTRPAQTYTPTATNNNAESKKTEHVDGYYRKNGTYVQPYDRKAPSR